MVKGVKSLSDLTFSLAYDIIKGDLYGKNIRL